MNGRDLVIELDRLSRSLVDVRAAFSHLSKALGTVKATVMIAGKRECVEILEYNVHTVWVSAPDGTPIKRHVQKHGLQCFGATG